MIQSNKNGDLSVTSIPTCILRHVPISCLKLNASLYSYNKCLTSVISPFVKQELSKLMQVSKFSLSCISFCHSCLTKGIYLSCPLSPFQCIHKFVIMLAYIIYRFKMLVFTQFCCRTPCLTL